MMNRRILIFTVFVLLLLGLTGCGSGDAEIEKVTFTETEFLQQSFFCQNEGYAVEFQQMKIKCTKEIGDQDVVIMLIPAIADGHGYFQILYYTIDGEIQLPNTFTDVNALLALDTFPPEEGYEVVAMIIRPGTLTLVQMLIVEPE